MSLAIYRLFLYLYPREFRQRWGAEMMETFRLQIADDWWEAWRSAVPELLTATRKGLALPAVSLAGSGTLLGGLVWALGNSPVLVALYHRTIAKLGG